MSSPLFRLVLVTAASLLNVKTAFSIRYRKGPLSHTKFTTSEHTYTVTNIKFTWFNFCVIQKLNCDKVEILKVELMDTPKTNFGL